MQNVSEEDIELLCESNNGHLFDVVPECSDWIVNWARTEHGYNGPDDADVCYDKLFENEELEYWMLDSLFNLNEEINSAFWIAFDEYVQGGWSEVSDEE